MSTTRLRSPGRAWLQWLAAAAVATALTACGGGGSSGDPSAAAPPSASSGTSAATPVTTTTASTSSSASPGTGSTAPATDSGSAGAPASSSGTAITSTTAAAPAPLVAAANVLPIVMDRGTDGSSINAPFVSVTVCQPGTQACRTIDHILVDTGSVGLRVSASALAGVALPQVAAASGAAYGECASFASGYTWGSVRRADVRLAGEQANAIPVQVYDDGSAPFAAVPSGCSNTGVALDPAGSNGILGVGFSTRDCGSACASSSLPGMYFSCAATGCTAALAPLSSQVGNPVALLEGPDRNGVAIVLPDLAAGGTPSLAGSLVMGVGTRDNNQVGTLGIYTANSVGNFTTTYQGRTSAAFIDSGSNGLFFADSTIPRCATGFYCPSSPLELSATVAGTNGSSRSVPFVVENAAGLPYGTAAARLAGSVVVGRSFDWGLPFFFGRTVFVAFDGMNTPQGLGPFWAF